MLAAERIRRLNRLYAVASGINEAIIRIPGEQQLYLEACRIAVERGGFMMAWVGRNDPVTHELVPVARWGKDDGYVDSVRILTDTSTRAGLGPGGKAFRTGEASVCNDIEADTESFAFRKEALAHGYRSCGAFPLKQDGRPVAVFFVYAAEPLYFDQHELTLFTSLADNFSFAIEARERESERQQMNAAVRASEARMRAVIDNQAECVKILAPDGRILEINPAGLSLLQAGSADELVGRVVLDFVHEEDREKYIALHAQVMRGETQRLQARAVGLKGRVMWVETSAVALRSESGAIEGVLCVTQDVTESRAQQLEILSLNAELEQRVRHRTAQLEAANHELQAFSYSVAHDLRAPLTAIGGFSQALEALLSPAADPKAVHYLSRMREGVQRTSEMIDALLSLATVTRTKLRWESVDLSAMAHRAFEHCERQYAGRSLSARIQPGMVAQGDPRLLQLVMDNLVSNACKFSDTRELAQIEVGSLTGPEGEVVYEVRDNGVGFDMAYAANLFGVFQRLHKQTEFPGTGIGLANVRRILTRHSGRIWAVASPDQGASFYFTLGKEA
ncbi:MAG: GAF domain-containing protein [Ramlibacter sp.]|nr:GAF domain-containing protein [Ramlibacter sp.]